MTVMCTLPTIEDRKDQNSLCGDVHHDHYGHGIAVDLRQTVLTLDQQIKGTVAAASTVAGGPGHTY